jgi:hypothetical protein
MNAAPPRPRYLSELPLWRLLLALDGAERVAGPDSETARILSRLIADKLRADPPAAAPPGQGARDG